MPAASERWRALHPLARWAAIYLACVLVSLAVGLLSPLGVGNAFFFAGVAALVGSLLNIRFGGDKVMVMRTRSGAPIFERDPVARGIEMRRGLALFGLALAMWAPLVAATMWR